MEMYMTYRSEESLDEGDNGKVKSNIKREAQEERDASSLVEFRAVL
jgi:hypothetical protein